MRQVIIQALVQMPSTTATTLPQQQVKRCMGTEYTDLTVPVACSCYSDLLVEAPDCQILFFPHSTFP